MAIAIRIDFDLLYEIESISEDLRISSFLSELQNGAYIPLKVEISNESHELIPNVYNLSFGPASLHGNIDDRALLAHKDHSRVFSTILFNALTYLKNNPDHYLGIDGSDNARAYLYYRFLQRNYDYLNKYFNMYGTKYYVRISRFGKTQYENPFDFDDIIPIPKRIKKGDGIPSSIMYNYFIFNVKKKA